MRTISAADANRHFSRLLRDAALGEEITVLSRGRAVAKIIPADTEEQSRAQAKQRLLARLQQRQATGQRNWTREELYEG